MTLEIRRYDLSFDGPADGGWYEIAPDVLYAEMVENSGEWVLFRDEYGDIFLKIGSLKDDDGDIVGFVVRREMDGYMFFTDDCETWDPIGEKHKARGSERDGLRRRITRGQQ